MSEQKNWFVYIVLTRCGKLYTGIATDIERRFQEHCDISNGDGNKGAKYFRGHQPLKVVYSEKCLNRSDASSREYKIKALSAAKKRSLIVQKGDKI